jgi:hypothetical protein
VNASWLLTGEGQPLTVEETSSQSGAVLLPVSHQLLAGLPSENAGEFVGVQPALSDWARPSRYWYTPGPTAVELNYKMLKVEVGDRLLVETDVSIYVGLDALLGKLCVLQLPADSDAVLQLFKIGRAQGEGVFQADHFDAEAALISGPTTGEGKRLRHLQYDDDDSPSSARNRGVKRQLKKESQTGRITGKLLGVCILLVREL